MVIRRWRTKALVVERAATAEHRCLVRRTQYLGTGLLLVGIGQALAVGNTNSSTRSSDANAIMLSCDQSSASTHDGQHLSSVTSAMVDGELNWCSRVSHCMK